MKLTLLTSFLQLSSSFIIAMFQNSLLFYFNNMFSLEFIFGKCRCYIAQRWAGDSCVSASHAHPQEKSSWKMSGLFGRSFFCAHWQRTFIHLRKWKEFGLFWNVSACVQQVTVNTEQIAREYLYTVYIYFKFAAWFLLCKVMLVHGASAISV